MGKTETALALSDLLYGGEHNLITINMSEFQEAHTVSTLKGSPPGYVGYGEGGVLTEAVRRRPYSVVLLDEVEKAHPDVLELFFQVFDKGTMEDGEGRQIDFKNTIIILTSNAGTDTLDEAGRRPRNDARSRRTCERAKARVEQDLQAGIPRPTGHHSVLSDPGREPEQNYPAEARQNPSGGSGNTPDGRCPGSEVLVDGVREPLHGGGERREERGQHSHAHAAARYIAAIAGRWRKARSRNRFTSASGRQLVCLFLIFWPRVRPAKQETRLPATQTERPFRVKSSLGDDALLLESFSGTESMSAPFRYALRVLSSDANIDLKALLKKPVVLSMPLEEDRERHVHGVISRLALVGESSDNMFAYEVEVVPWLWLLTLFSNCRIFQNKSVPEIVEQVFNDRGFSDFRLDLQGSFPPREYCVQYRETDFNFVSRLLEEEGIFYFFRAHGREAYAGTGER